ncbi:MAG: metal ABC transporter permease [Thermomicrobiales bacterium]
MTWLTDPWSYPFMQNAFLAAALVGLICGVTGTFVVLKGLAFMGDALAHSIFPGVVIAYIVGGSFLLWAMIAAVMVSLMIGVVSSHARLSNDTAIGVLFVGAFALGIALISTQQSYARDLTALLTGSILGVSRSDLILTALVGGVVVLLILLSRRELSAIAFDRVFAESSGIHVRFYELLFLVLLSLTIVISLQTVGNIMVLAMLVTPAATARLLTIRLPATVALSAVLGMLSGLSGLYISYHFSLSSGAAIVLVATVLFGVVFMFSPRTGVVTTAVRRYLHYPHPERDTFAERTTP